MADGHRELRTVIEGVDHLVRRLEHRADQMNDTARRLRIVSTRPAFVAPVGDCSRLFVDSQAKRLERLAWRYLLELITQLRRLRGELRPAKRELVQTFHSDASLEAIEVGAVVDWKAAEAPLAAVARCCPVPGGKDWEETGASDDPELPATKPFIVQYRPPVHLVRPLPRPSPRERRGGSTSTA